MQELQEEDLRAGRPLPQGELLQLLVQLVGEGGHGQGEEGAAARLGATGRQGGRGEVSRCRHQEAGPELEPVMIVGGSLFSLSDICSMYRIKGHQVHGNAK